MFDNEDYRTLSEEIGITLYNTLGFLLPTMDESSKKMSDNFGRPKNWPKAEGIKP